MIERELVLKYRKKKNNFLRKERMTKTVTQSLI